MAAHHTASRWPLRSARGLAWLQEHHHGGIHTAVRVFDCLVRVLCAAVRLTIRNHDTGQRRRQQSCVASHGASCATKPFRVRGRSAGHPFGLPCAHVGQLGTGAPARSTSPAPHPALRPCRALVSVLTSHLPCAGGGDAAQSGTARASSVIASIPLLHLAFRHAAARSSVRAPCPRWACVPHRAAPLMARSAVRGALRGTVLVCGQSATLATSSRRPRRLAPVHAHA